MTAVTIFGTGTMGSAVADVLTSGGVEVDHVTRAGTDGPLRGDIVILAVPYAAAHEIAAEYADRLAGKVVVDMSNPLDFTTFDSLVVPTDSSAAAELAEALPDSQVVKAFNTNFAATLGARTVGAVPTTVLIAGDDADAKSRLSEVVTAGGLRAVDAGALTRARELEAIGFLQLTLAVAEKVGWDGGFAVAA